MNVSYRFNSSGFLSCCSRGRFALGRSPLLSSLCLFTFIVVHSGSVVAQDNWGNGEEAEDDNEGEEIGDRIHCRWDIGNLCLSDDVCGRRWGSLNGVGWCSHLRGPGSVSPAFQNRSEAKNVAKQIQIESQVQCLCGPAYRAVEEKSRSHAGNR